MHQINHYFSIFAGIIKFSSKDIDGIKLNSHFQNWEKRLFDGQYQETLAHLRNNYYDSFLLGMLPALLDEKNQLNEKYLRRYTRRKIEFPQVITRIKNDEVELSAEYFDLYFFPNGLALYFFKWNPVNNPRLNQLSDYIFQMRNLHTKLICGTEELTLKDWIYKQLSEIVPLDDNWTNYTPHLKTYSIIDIQEQLPDKENDELLYDLATLSPLGTAAGNNENSPSEIYFKQIIEKHKISVFKNWSALCLFDTFTMLSINRDDSHRSWEYDYFNIYLMAIYIKGFIYLANTTLSDVTIANKKSELVKNTFIEFINDYYITNISYRFLPNILNEKMTQGLDIPVEIAKMESKINRLNETIKRNIDNRLNITILILAIFSVFSVITDLSEWIDISMESKSWLYPYAGIFALIVFILSIFIAINYSKFKRNE